MNPDHRFRQVVSAQPGEHAGQPVDTEQHLLRAIADEPDEDTSRLAFADFLDERGGADDVARAEFIRAQVRLAREPDAPDAADLRERMQLLWVWHRQTWKVAVPQVAGINWRGYDRGFLTVIDADRVRAFVKHAAAVCRAAPVTSVRFLSAAAGDGVLLAELPELARLRSLDLTGCRNLTDADAAALAGSPGVRNLRVLRLGGNQIGPAGVSALAASPHLGALRSIEIGLQTAGRRTVGPALGELRTAYPAADVR